MSRVSELQRTVYELNAAIRNAIEPRKALQADIAAAQAEFDEVQSKYLRAVYDEEEQQRAINVILQAEADRAVKLQTLILHREEGAANVAATLQEQLRQRQAALGALKPREDTVKADIASYRASTVRTKAKIQALQQEAAEVKEEWNLLLRPVECYYCGKNIKDPSIEHSLNQENCPLHRTAPCDICGAEVEIRDFAAHQATCVMQPWIGFAARDLADGANNRIVLITDVVANSPADQAGCQLGDVIVTANDHHIDSKETLADVLSTANVGDTVTLDVLRMRSRHSAATQQRRLVITVAAEAHG